MKRYCILSILLILIFIPGKCRANNISVSNSTGIAGVSPRLRFDVSWENSWRVAGGTPTWDAAWVFVKYRCISNNATWWHLKLNDTGHSAPSGSELALGRVDEKSGWNSGSNPYVGAFLHRSSEGTGSVDYNGVELAFELDDNNLVSTNTIDTRVFAVEMVYISTGSFYAGDAGAGTSRFRAGNTANDTFLVDYNWSENSGYGTYREISNSDNALYAEGAISVDDLDPAYPTGYGSFYMMKYGITQGQYRDFLNALQRDQQASRCSAVTVGNFMYSDDTQNTPQYRNGVKLTSDPGAPEPRVYSNDLDDDNNANETVDGQWIACNYMNWADGAAYAAWAGLRPYTELEYEKACRGPLTPVANEYAWGTATMYSVGAYTMVNSGESNEGITTGYSTTQGNALYTTTKFTPNGPCRVGIFAANGSNTGRVSAGASYWGIMELSGNLWERPVTAGNADGCNFTGLHGNGTLTGVGNASVTNWPDTDAIGAGFRGGTWSDSSGYLCVSDRASAASTYADRLNLSGFRAARSAPASAGE